MIQAKFGLNWPIVFRGEDFWKSLQTDDGRQVMAIAHTGELKIGGIFKVNCSVMDGDLKKYWKHYDWSMSY